MLEARPLIDCSTDGKDLDGHRESAPIWTSSFRTASEKGPAPRGGPVLSYRASQNGAYPLIVRVADLAFRQSSASVVPSTLVASARYLPGLPLVFLVYDPVSVVVVLPTFFQPPLVLRWILTGTLATQAVKAGSSVELTTPLAAPLFFSFSVIVLSCPTAPGGAQSGGGVWNEAELNAVPPVVANVVTWIGPSEAVDGLITPSVVALSMSGTVPVASAAYGLNRTAPPSIESTPARSVSRFVPVIVTTAPDKPHVGVNEAMVGAHAPAPAVDRKVPVLVFVPPSFEKRTL